MLPPGFIYLDQIDPTIIPNLRMAGDHNFLGCPAEGYHSNRVILTQQAAQALQKIQTAVRNDGYSLVIYDAYRPQRAVNHFIRWSEDLSDQKMKAHYYPHIDKAKAFELGYLAKRSTHSRGSTIDITLISLGQTPHAITASTRTLTDGRIVSFLDDGTVDMGTSFDLFDTASHHYSELVTKDAQERRDYLRAQMVAQGFEPYAYEWWHYTLKDEPFPDMYFDFEIQ